VLGEGGRLVAGEAEVERGVESAEASLMTGRWIRVKRALQLLINSYG